MKAIILADGKNQILPLEGGLKCLSKINDDIVLDKLIKNIRECGIKDISVIVGFVHEADGSLSWSFQLGYILLVFYQRNDLQA